MSDGVLVHPFQIEVLTSARSGDIAARAQTHDGLAARI